MDKDYYFYILSVISVLYNSFLCKETPFIVFLILIWFFKKNHVLLIVIKSYDLNQADLNQPTLAPTWWYYPAQKFDCRAYLPECCPDWDGNSASKFIETSPKYWEQNYCHAFQTISRCWRTWLSQARIMHISTKNSYSWETGLWLETYLRLTLVHKPRRLDTLLAPQKTGKTLNKVKSSKPKPVNAPSLYVPSWIWAIVTLLRTPQTPSEAVALTAMD